MMNNFDRPFSRDPSYNDEISVQNFQHAPSFFCQDIKRPSILSLFPAGKRGFLFGKVANLWQTYYTTP